MLLSDLLPRSASSPVVGSMGLPPSTTCMPPPLNASTPRSSSSQLSSAGISSETQRGLHEQEGREAANIPTQLCTYYAKGINGVGQGCLRVNCKFFHGTEEMLEELRRGTGEGALSSGDNEADERVRPALLNMNLGDKKPIVCLAYLSNSCRRPGCRFLHLPSNVRPLPIAVCECFTRGSCTRTRCRFFHGPKELLSKMHAQGVTMYNPSTNEPHDPSSSLDLMRLQERTTVPLSAPPHRACLPPPPLPPQGNMFAYHTALPSMHMPTPPAAAQAPFIGHTTVGLFPQTHGGYQQAPMSPAPATAANFAFAYVHQMEQRGPIPMSNSSAPFHASIPSALPPMSNNLQQQQQHGQGVGGYIIQHNSNGPCNNSANAPFSFYNTNGSVPPSAPQQLQSMPSVNYLASPDNGRFHMQQLSGHVIGGSAAHLSMVPNSAGQVLVGSHYHHHLEQQQQQINAFSTTASTALQQQMYAPHIHTNASLPSQQPQMQPPSLYGNLCNGVGTAQPMLQTAAINQMPQYRY